MIELHFGNGNLLRIIVFGHPSIASAKDPDINSGTLHQRETLLNGSTWSGGQEFHAFGEAVGIMTDFDDGIPVFFEIFKGAADDDGLAHGGMGTKLEHHLFDGKHKLGKGQSKWIALHFMLPDDERR